jgi:ketosteroid isomerase-like protein
MSDETVELATGVMEALSRQDLPRLLELTDPAIEWHSFFAELGEGGVYRGHDGTRQYMSDLTEAWEVVRADVDDVVGAGDVAVRVGRIHYRRYFPCGDDPSSGISAGPDACASSCSACGLIVPA